jgi:hypothetical protein
MAKKKTIAGKVAQQALKVIYESDEGQRLMDEVVVSLKDPKLDVRVKDVAVGYKAIEKAHDLYKKGMGSKVTTQLANKVMDEFDMLPPRVQAGLTGTLKNLGAKGSIPVGPQGRAGLVLPNFNDPSSMRAFYEDDKTRVDVNRNRVSARRNLGKVGPFDMYARGAVGREGYEVGVGGGVKFAKGGKVKQYAKGGGVRKPKLK